jgi:hypothetical protein
MGEGREKQNDLLDTTDCLEAIAVFRGWKNILFVIALLCLLFLQAAFWLVNTGYVKGVPQTRQNAFGGPKTIDDTQSESAEVATADINKSTKVENQPVSIQQGISQEIKEAAKQAAGEPNQPTEDEATSANSIEPQQKKTRFRFHLNITFGQLARLIRFFDFVLILAAVLYCLTMLFSLEISLLGRLGGINHICRAFFISLIMIVVLLPWQRFFGGVLAGAIYTPKELLTGCSPGQGGRIFGTALYYLRFTVLPLLAMLLLIFSQIRSMRWAKAILRRLDVV